MKSIKLLNTLLLMLCPILLMAQQITYSQPEKDDYRNTDFEIIGKVGPNILVYKNYRDRYAVSLYNDNMDLQDRVAWNFLPEKLLSIDFVAYPQKFLLFYQYQHRNIVYLYAAQLNENAKFLTEPRLIDSTKVGFLDVKHNIYSVEYSEDHSKVLVYKINQDRDYNNTFYTFMLDDNLNLTDTGKVELDMGNKKNYLNNFTLTNNGDFIFTKLIRSGSSDFLNDAQLIMKPAKEDSFHVYNFNLDNNYLDELKSSVDNSDKKIYLTSYYYDRKRGDVAGLYYTDFNWGTDSIERQKFIEFSDDLKESARNNSSQKAAFNDYFIKQLIVKKNGGFLINMESYYTRSRNEPWDRMNYLYGLSPYGYYYYSPFSPWYYSPYWNNDNDVRYYYNDVAMLSYDENGKLVWSNFIRKSQFDDGTPSFLSYKLVNLGNELQFLFNVPYRRDFLLTAVSLQPNGKLAKLPTLRGLDRGYKWMPRYGKQISARQVIVPCILRNYICFAKIDF